MNIRNWVEATFAGPEPKLFLELGAHRGEDTAWLAALPNVDLIAFEPDPRNRIDVPHVTVIEAAVSDLDGSAPFILSESGWPALFGNEPWTRSSSLRRPKNHLTRFPVTFGKTITVRTVTLDTMFSLSPATIPPEIAANVRRGVQVDFIWCDIQGAEADMIRGAEETLRRTHYLYTEYSNDEMYEGQATLSQLMAMIPEFRIVELWAEDVLLENTQFHQEQKAA